jgi:hypothetical protein
MNYREIKAGRCPGTNSRLVPVGRSGDEKSRETYRDKTLMNRQGPVSQRT